MKKVCIITAARSEYGLLKWVIDGVNKDNELELQLVVTGAHLSEEHGKTVQFIEEDGYPISARVDMQLASENKRDIMTRPLSYLSYSKRRMFKQLQK